MTKSIDGVIEQLKELAGIEDVAIRFSHPPADVFDREWVLGDKKPRRYICWVSWDGENRMGSRVDFVHGSPMSLALAEIVALRELAWTIATTGLAPGEGDTDYALLEQLLLPVHQWAISRILEMETRAK